ncbi:hypothetical protein PF008_g6484 [Phytophthora fragariae]|uniref:Uncharacterized protein n=1 Tax=Phytophthora fragariae TaxID=53985 RepID=A0A6G0S741_9STRA|nr:hypothetical protein PF008_g6484 [Phytophthora fragariae]
MSRRRCPSRTAGSWIVCLRRTSGRSCACGPSVGFQSSAPLPVAPPSRSSSAPSAYGSLATCSSARHPRLLLNRRAPGLAQS